MPSLQLCILFAVLKEAREAYNEGLVIYVIMPLPANTGHQPSSSSMQHYLQLPNDAVANTDEKGVTAVDPAEDECVLQRVRSIMFLIGERATTVEVGKNSIVRCGQSDFSSHQLVPRLTKWRL